MSAEKPNAERLLRETLVFVVSELQWYAGKYGLGPARLQYALSKGERALRAVPSAMGQPLTDEGLGGPLNLYMTGRISRTEFLKQLNAAITTPSLEKLRERIEALPRYRWTKQGVTEHPDGNWLNCEAVLAEFEKVNT
jgi:cytochrome P450